MALADRDYYRSDRTDRTTPASYRRRRTSRLGIGSITLWLIAANVAVYVIDLILVRMGIVVGVGRAASSPFDQGNVMYLPPLAGWFHFSEALAIEHLQVWRFITFQFVHANGNHLIFNMLALYFFGPLVESYLGPRRFLPYYLLSGIGGAVLYLILLLVGWRIGSPWVPLMGASAGIFAVLIAAAQIAPNAQVLIYFLFPVELRTMALLFTAFAVFTVLFRGQNAGGEAAHLGGAAVGYFLLGHQNALDRIAWLGKRPPPF